MRFYSGIDLHARESVICIIDDKDTIHFRDTPSNHLEYFLSTLNKFSPRPAVAVEATLNWYWLVDGLQDAGFQVKLAHPLPEREKTHPRSAQEKAKNSLSSSRRLCGTASYTCAAWCVRYCINTDEEDTDAPA